MSILDYIYGRIRRGIITFVNIVTLANRDYPYHDYETATTTSTPVLYRVGENNQLGRGDQNKLFTSKSTLIFCTTDTYIILNSAENVPILLRANDYYEFMSNIHAIHYYYSSAEGTIYIWVEGVAPQHAGRPE